MAWKQILIIALLLTYGVVYLMVSSVGYYSWRSAEWASFCGVFGARVSRPVGRCAWDNIGTSNIRERPHISVDSPTPYLNVD
jgi:hypothetical protein